MRLMHISDLHLGKRVHEMSMLEDQAYILEEILEIAKREAVDGMLIAGDVYDKSVPSAEAVRLLDGFLTKAVGNGLDVYLISGNHDSAERLAFGGRLLRGGDGTAGSPASGAQRHVPRLYLAPVFGGRIEPVRAEDGYGPLFIWQIPFIRPAAVRRFFPDREIGTYNDAFRAVTESLEMDRNARNVLVAHQFVTGASRCESEDISVGGIDNVDASLMEAFDYAALGHIHNPQNLGSGHIRYCGTPLKYSFSEAAQEKSVTIVELREKGTVQVRTVLLSPLHDMRKIRGSYAELTLKENYQGTRTDDYLQVTLTDEEDIPNGMERLRAVYPNLLRLDYDNRRTREKQTPEGAKEAEQQTPLAHFAEFYRIQNNQEMSEEQRAFMQELIEKVWN